MIRFRSWFDQMDCLRVQFGRDRCIAVCSASVDGLELRSLHGNNGQAVASDRAISPPFRPGGPLDSGRGLDVKFRRGSGSVRFRFWLGRACSYGGSTYGIDASPRAPDRPGESRPTRMIPPASITLLVQNGGLFVRGRNSGGHAGAYYHCVIRRRFVPRGDAGMGTLERLPAARFVALSSYWMGTCLDHLESRHGRLQCLVSERGRAVSRQACR